MIDFAMALKGSIGFVPKYAFLRVTLLCISFLATATTYAQQPFITTWKTDIPAESNSTSITIPTVGGGYNYQVDWNNDGIYDQSGITGSATHDFGVAGTYTIRIRGAFPRIYFHGWGDGAKLLDVGQWGDIAWTSMFMAFAGCTNLNISATDLPDLSGVTNMSAMFQNCANLNGPTNIGNWNTANVTNMYGMFVSASSFNQPIGNWNTANVTNMMELFLFADAFNQPVGNWNTGNVTNMNSMFRGANVFNQPVGNWNTANVTDMSSLFSDAHAFNQPVGNWNTSNVSIMTSMFRGASSFNQPIGSWNTANVKDMVGMFISASAFNQPIGNWNVSKVTDMAGMFISAIAFNQPINNWTTANVTNMNAMFRDATAFNQPIGNWITSSVINMSELFFEATSFNQPIGNWNTSNVILMTSMFRGASSFNQPIGNWNTANVVDMVGMFFDATAFNQPIGNWNTSNVINMNVMFSQASSFNQPIGNWNTGNVTTARMMFLNAAGFNQPIHKWNTANVTDMGEMFFGASAFNQSLGDWSLHPFVNLNNLLDNSGLDCGNYTATLIGWSEKASTPDYLSLGAAGRLYGTNAAAARTNLTTTKNWLISGDAASGTNCAVLPVVLITFTGKSQDNGVLLAWETTSETNNAGFDIEKSSNAKTFEKIGFVDGGGDLNRRKAYHFMDTNPLPATYYRLKQLDFDGKFEYSRIISVRRPEEKIVIYPNPTSNTIFLLGVASEQKLVVRNAGGKVVHEQLWSSGDTVKLSLLPDGLYFVTVAGETSKIIVQNKAL
jgi:surface protein